MAGNISWCDKKDLMFNPYRNTDKSNSDSDWIIKRNSLLRHKPPWWHDHALKWGISIFDRMMVGFKQNSSVARKMVNDVYTESTILYTTLCLKLKKRSKVKWPYLPLVTGFSSKLISNLAEHPILLYWPGHPLYLAGIWNPGPLSFEASALLTELTRPDYTPLSTF